MTNGHVERHLAAILVADVVGYSRMMGHDEKATFDRLQAFRKETFDPATQQFRGRIFKSTGDGILVEFASAVDSVQCAVEVLQALEAQNNGLSDDLRMDLRIGIHLGDVLIEDGDVFGDRVNVAARLEGEAEPGTICISEDIYRLVRTKLPIECHDLGRKALKNIAEPIQAYQIGGSGPGAVAPDGDAPGIELPAVAVLPFDNMSNDPEQDYFSDGLTEDIITALSLWRSFPVIARNSSFTYKGQSVRIQDAARELGARYILEGSVRKAGSRLRITAQLIDADNGHHVWADKFDRQLEDIFEVQDEITHRIAAKIIPELEHFEQRRSATKPTDDLTAWDLYLRGMEWFHGDTMESNQAATDLFEQAVSKDPNYCDAWARLGWCCAKQVMLLRGAADDSLQKKGLEAAQRAVAIDASSALAHMALGSVYVWSGDAALGLAEAQRALELNPNLAQAALAVGNRLDLMGDAENGIVQLERALTLNPLDPVRWRYMAYLARAFLVQREFDQAAEWSRKGMLLRPDLPEALFRYAVCVAHLDHVEEARDVLEKCDRIEPGYVAKMKDWRPYPDDERNNWIMDGLVRHNLLG